MSEDENKEGKKRKICRTLSRKWKKGDKDEGRVSKDENKEEEKRII